MLGHSNVEGSAAGQLLLGAFVAMHVRTVPEVCR
jgi:hypothetical protein